MRFFKTLHLMSVDVVLGALLFQCLLTSIFLPNQATPLPVSLALAFSIWSVYLIDRLIDNRKPDLNSALHAFQRKHTFAIQSIIIANLLTLVVLIVYLPKYLIYGGLLIGMMVLIYWVFLIVGFFKRVCFSKEISTAIIYALGVSLYVSVNLDAINMAYMLLIVGLLCLLAFHNVVLFTLLSHSDLKKDFTLRLVEVLFICLWFTTLFFTHLSVFLLLPFLLTFVIHLWIHYISASKQRAWVGEVAFFSPLFYYLYAIIST